MEKYSSSIRISVYGYIYLVKRKFNFIFNLPIYHDMPLSLTSNIPDEIKLRPKGHNELYNDA